MIRRVVGEVISIRESSVVVDVSGVGLEVKSCRSVVSAVSIGQQAVFLIHTRVSENDISLYGFLDNSYLDVFEKLLTVSGIGPRSALAILDVANPQKIIAAINSGRSDLLATASGVGAKTASRIIVELKGKLILEGDFSSGVIENDADALEALMSLGYGREQAKAALREVPMDVVKTEDRIKAVLQKMSRK